MEEVIFIDSNGNIKQDRDICSHIALAMKLIENDEELKQKYQSSNIKRYDLFLIQNMGYISVSVDSVYGIKLIVNNKCLTDTQRLIMNNYLKAGAKLTLTEPEIDNQKSHQKRYNLFKT